MEGKDITEGQSIDPNTKKSKNAEKNEAKRLAKLEKFAKKQEKLKMLNVKKNEGESSKKSEKKKDLEEIVIQKIEKGEKKDLSHTMETSYNPKVVEAHWYDWWEAQGFFKPEFKEDGSVKDEGVFVIAAPPPNVTGSLHIGHAIFVAIQDTLSRWHRMQGKTVLFNIGTDHAGISTQAVVEKRLWAEQGLTRHDLGREKFVEKVWQWKDLYGDKITNQLKRLGGSYDWGRERFTLEPMLCKAVNENFVRLHDEGIIYRATKLINWCVRLNTALSNLEVENKELTGRTLLTIPGYENHEKFEFGVLVTFGYPIEGSDEKIIVATTRIETMLGDTAVAVHPDDPRYQHLHGKYVKHPFLDRRLPIVTDAILVDMSFGSGAVKITPAHDFNDYEVGKRHNLPFINILNDDGTFNANAGPFQGMKRFHVRVAVTEALKEKGLYVETKDNPMVVPMCAKSGDIIEPLLKPQWWVDCKEMAREAMKAVRNKELEIVPKASEKEWFRWLENIQDWCISRQLWWGHRVPAYLVRLEGKEIDASDGKYWISGRTYEEALERAKQKFPDSEFTLEQDPDVLDTWFSSGLWPFSIFGWPEETEDIKKFYPTSLLETGWDILFFWVARMVMLGLKLTGKVPFKKVFCHAMIRDAHGRKMSKSLGNVIDPIDVIEGITLEELHKKLEMGNLDPKEIKKAKEGQKTDYPNGIPECGTDALRFALCAYTSTGRDLNLDILRVEGYRRFSNKLWNATRFALMKLGDKFEPKAGIQLNGTESLPEKWILHKLNETVQEVNEALKEMNFMTATSAVHGFWLYNLCDIYIEVIKPSIDSTEDQESKHSLRDTLYTCLDQGLKLLHPFMPFVTEELYQRLPRRPNDNCPTISKTRYPSFNTAFEFPEQVKQFEFVFDVVKTARSMLVNYHIKKNATIYITCSDEDLTGLLNSQIFSIKTLVKGLNTVEMVTERDAIPAGCATLAVSPQCHLSLLVKGIVDLESEIKHLKTQLDKVERLKEQLHQKTKIPDYENKVPVEVRDANQSKLNAFQAEIDALSHSIQDFLNIQD